MSSSSKPDRSQELTLLEIRNSKDGKFTTIKDDDHYHTSNEQINAEIFPKIVVTVSDAHKERHFLYEGIEAEIMVHTLDPTEVTIISGKIEHVLKDSHYVFLAQKVKRKKHNGGPTVLEFDV